MDAVRFPAAAVLRAEALADFRSQVEALSRPIDWERVEYRRARCKRFNHALGQPEIQYAKASGDRGRWFIACDHDHAGDVQGGGSLFEFVSGPLDRDDWLYLRDVKAASDAAIKDVLALRRRSTSTRSTRRIPAPSTAYYDPRSTYRLPAPLAPRQVRQLPARSRSPSIEVLDPPPTPTFEIYLFHKKNSPPLKLHFPIGSQTFVARLGYDDRRWEAAGVKLADLIRLLVYSDQDGAAPFWFPGRVCDLSVPASCGPLIAACDGVSPAPSLLRRFYQHACDIELITF